MVAPIGGVPQSASGWLSVMGGPRYRNQGPFDFGAATRATRSSSTSSQGELRRLVNTGTWAAAPAVPGQPSATNWGTGFTAVCGDAPGPRWRHVVQRSTRARTPSSGGSLKRIRLLGPTNSVAAISGGGQVGRRRSVPDPDRRARARHQRQPAARWHGQLHGDGRRHAVDDQPGDRRRQRLRADHGDATVAAGGGDGDGEHAELADERHLLAVRASPDGDAGTSTWVVVG
jgi:hypothetical protein